MSAGTPPLTANDDWRPLSWRRLVLLFVVALLLFCAMRWDGDRWLKRQLLPRLATHGIHAAALERVGGRLRLSHVSLDGVRVGGAQMVIDRLDLAPVWPSLLRLTPAARVTLRWRQAAVEGDVAQGDDDRLALRGLTLTLPVTMVTPLLPAMPVKLGGAIACHGGMQLLLATLQPEAPDLRCDWRQATAAMGAKPTPLGSYTLTLKGDGDKAWPWKLHGGDVAKVEGKGTIHPRADVPLPQWPLDGTITVRAGKGPLAATVGALLGNKPHAISGTVAKPVLR